MPESDAPRPPGFARALLLLTRMGLRRRVARLRHAFARRRRQLPGAPRGPTPRKRPRGRALVLFLATLMLFNAGVLTHHFLERHEEERTRVERTAIVEAALAGRLGWPRHAIEQLEAALRPNAAPGPDIADDKFREELEARRSGAAQRDTVAQWVEQTIGPEADIVRRSVARQRDAGVALLISVLALAIFLSQLGARNQDLGQVETSFAWLFTLPVSTRAIFLSRLLEYAVGDFFSWCIFAPFLFVVGLWAGAGLAALPLALAGALYLNLLLASVQIGIETWLRKRAAPARRKNLQGAFTLLGVLVLMGSVAVALAPAGPGLLFRAVAFTGTWVNQLPPALPIQLLGGGGALAAAAVMLAITALFITAALACVAGLVRGGLDAEAGAYRGRRGTWAGTVAAHPSLLRGVIGKDLKLLWRDRNLLVQTLVLPAVIVGFQLVVNPPLSATLSGSFDHVPVLAFGLGAYILMFSAAPSLAVEGRALWLLLTTPARLERVILGKAALWGVFAALLPAALLAWAALRAPVLTTDHLIGAVFALVGIFLYAVIAAGIGALATDVLEPEAKRRLRPAALYRLMVLATFYALGFYVDGMWQRCGIVVLAAGVAFAVWQKFADEAPFLLDPEARPPRRIGLAHGMVAALVFFELQILLAAALAGTEGQRATTLALWSYLGASILLMTLLALFAGFSNRKLEAPALPLPPPGLVRSLGAGFRLGVAAAVAGCAWLLIVRWVEPLRVWHESLAIHELSFPGDRIRLLVLGVVLAPLTEEFLFRRLIFHSMRRTCPFGGAALLSAVMFTMVHPPISMPAVFVLGLATAWAYERTGRLAAPVLAHTVYNAIVLGTQLALR